MIDFGFSNVKVISYEKVTDKNDDFIIYLVMQQNKSLHSKIKKSDVVIVLEGSIMYSFKTNITKDIKGLESYIKICSVKNNEQFIHSIYYKIFPYFLSQLFCDRLTNNLFYFDENAYPQYIEYVEEHIQLMNGNQTIKSLTMDQFPAMDQFLKSSRSFIRKITLISDEKPNLLFNFLVELDNGETLSVKGRNYQIAYEQAILIALEAEYSKYFYSSISNLKEEKLEQSGELIDSKYAENKIFKYLEINPTFGIEVFKNETGYVMTVMEKNDIIALEYENSNIQKLVEKGITRAVNRKQNNLTHHVINSKKVKQLCEVYSFGELTLFHYNSQIDE